MKKSFLDVIRCPLCKSSFDVHTHMENSDDIIQRLKQIFDDPSLAEQMGKEGRKFVNEEFDANTTISIFNQAIN